MSKLYPFWWFKHPPLPLAYFLKGDGTWGSYATSWHTWFYVYSNSNIVDGFNRLITNQLGKYLVPNSQLYGTAIGPRFTGNGQPITKCRFKLSKFMSPIATFNAKLYAYNVSTSLPEGAALATSTTTLEASAITSSIEWYDFSFDGTFILQSGVKYTIVINILNYTLLSTPYNSVSVWGDESFGA